MKSKKAQLYGVTAFIYAIAIAIILIISILGLSKDLEASSQAGLYRFSAISATKTAEIFKKLLEQERGYVVDKSLFFTGAFGGYSVTEDLICVSTDSHAGPGIPDCKPDGSCEPGQESFCYPEVECGRVNMPQNFLGEKYVPYWKSYNSKCVPNTTKVMETFRLYAADFFGIPNENVLTAITAGVLYPVNFNYDMELNPKRDVDMEQGVLQTRWIPIGQELIFIRSPPIDPNVEYEVMPYLHLFSKTEFLDVYSEANASVEETYFENYLSDPQVSPIPTIIDEDYSVLKHMNDGNITSCKCDVASDMFDSNGDGIVDSAIGLGKSCKENSSFCAPTGHSFKALVNYINNNTVLYPNLPNSCTMPALNTLSDVYTGTCKLTTTNIDGKLMVVQFSQGCAGNNNDDKAMKCVFSRIINRMNNEIMSKPIRKNVASSYWGATIAKIPESTNTLYNERLSHVIDGKTTFDYYDSYYGWGYTNISGGEAMQINLTKLYDIDTINVYLLPHPSDSSYYRYKIEGSTDDITWFTIVDATTGQHRAFEQWNITPTKLRYIRLIGTYYSAGGDFVHVVELEALSDVNFRYELFSFNLTYNGQGVGTAIYNATDLDSPSVYAGDAPPFVANPNPGDCTIATCETGNKEYCYNFTGETCPCCGETAPPTTDFGGPGLTCCKATSADPGFLNRCWPAGCVGKVAISATTVAQKCAPISIYVSGLCQNCTNKNASLYDNGVYLLDGGLISQIGSVTISPVTFTTVGTHTVQARVDMNGNLVDTDTNETASIGVTINACGLNGEVPCTYQCDSTYFLTPGVGYCVAGTDYNTLTGKCATCGIPGGPCCTKGTRILPCGYIGPVDTGDVWECGSANACCNSSSLCYRCGTDTQVCCNSSDPVWPLTNHCKSGLNLNCVNNMCRECNTFHYAATTCSCVGAKCSECDGNDAYSSSCSTPVGCFHHSLTPSCTYEYEWGPGWPDSGCPEGTCYAEGANAQANCSVCGLINENPYYRINPSGCNNILQCNPGVGPCYKNSDCAFGLKCVFDYNKGIGHVENAYGFCSYLNNFGADYCTSTNPCFRGQGDCDNDDQCQYGFVCVRYPRDSETGYCMNLNLDYRDKDSFCKTFGCVLGQGDCDSNAECLQGKCINDPLESGGAVGDRDYCLDLGLVYLDKDTSCTDAHPCTYGQGDCEDDEDCADDLVCVEDPVAGEDADYCLGG